MRRHFLESSMPCQPLQRYYNHSEKIIPQNYEDVVNVYFIVFHNALIYNWGNPVFFQLQKISAILHDVISAVSIFNAFFGDSLFMKVGLMILVPVAKTNIIIVRLIG